MANDIDKTSPHYKGEFGSIYEVNQKFPSGGVEGDYVAIDGWAHYWNADRGTWCVNAQRDSYWDELITSIIEHFKTIKGATYMGVATTDTVPDTTAVKMFYFALQGGKYANFGNQDVAQGINVLLTMDGKSWTVQRLISVAQELGASTTMLMSQKAITDSINRKANTADVDEALAKKADRETVDTALGKKADKTDMDTKLGKKADKTDMDTKLGKKADKTDMDTKLGKKLDKTSVAQESGEAEDKVMSQKVVSTKLSDLYNNISTEIPKEIGYAQKIISKDGSLVQWGVSSVTSFIEITDFVKVTGIVGVPAHFYAVAFYNESKELVSDYNNYLYDFGGGVREIGDIFVLGREFPKAKYIRISGILTDVKIFKSIKLDIEKLKTDVYDKKNSYDIVIIGDSIAQNISSAFLRKMKSVGQHNVKSYAIGGESCLDTIAHRNIYPYTILPPFTIPANGASAALNVISSRWLGVKIAEDAISKTYFNQYSQGTNGEEAGSYIYGTGINPWDKKYCTIGGIHGYLQFNTSGSDRNTNVKFYRDIAGEAITFTHPQTIHEDDPIDSNSIIIVFMGTNGGWIPRDTRASFEDSFAHLIEYYQGIADKYGIENCLFLGFYMTAYVLQAVDKDVIARFKYMEAEFAKHFGTHYWSCYQYLRNYGLEDCGYAATEKDIRDVVQKGLTPCSVRGGTDYGVHLTSNASEAVANGVIRKLYQLGMIDECPQIAIDKTLKILTGTVKTTSNVGVNGIKLTFTNSSDSNKVFSVTTNDDGSYSLGISSGTYNITADSGTLNTTEITIGGNVFNEANFIKS